MMNTQELISVVTQALEDNKAHNISILDVSSLTDAMDNLIVCTATSTRHAVSLSQKVIEATKSAGTAPFGVEGAEYGEWILIDLSDIVVHIMLAEQRDFYNLEKLWAVTEESRKQSGGRT
jgi:ribosome-associated protein